ncbi:MAG TPA: type I restriction enzyme HsdR N-terminal domain-containing protein [Spirochaetota bacterium]|nr:type I restriction enzyme HsdR N-terminal domain-containing protein [Spirochaetota bacterium]
MAIIPPKVSDRLALMIKKYQPILENAKNQDKNEADTVTVITQILTDVFGYDQFTEITKEFAIKNTFCDLAIKVDGTIKFLIEAKAIGIKLNDNHISQATTYGAKEGIDWVVLTNGIHWIIYKMNYGSKIVHKQISSFDFTALKPKSTADHEQLFILCKEGLKKDAIEEFHAYKKIVNSFFIGSIIMGESVLETIKRELRKSSPGLKIDDKEIESILKNEVLKREIIDSEYAADAQEQYRLVLKKAKKDLARRTQVAHNAKPEITEETATEEIAAKPSEEFTPDISD